jgi:hypothetical protein
MRGYFDKKSGRFQLRPDGFKFLDGLAKLRLIRVVATAVRLPFSGSRKEAPFSFIPPNVD